MSTIVYIGGFEMPDKNAAAHRVLSNGKMLRDLGYNVVFIDATKDCENYKCILSTKNDIQGFDCFSMKYPVSNKDMLRYLSDIDDFKTVAKKYHDIEYVICYNYPSVSFLKLKSYCKANKIKLISDCTEWYTPKDAGFIYGILKGLDSSLRMRYIQKNIDGLIVISSYLQNYYKKCKNVLFLPPLVDTCEDKWQHSETAEKKDKIHLVYAGNTDKNKDKIQIILKYLSLLKDVPDYVLNIIGISKEHFNENYPEDLDTLNSLGEKVQFLGRLPHLETINYLKNSDFSIFIRIKSLNTQAGFPTKFVESLSSGIPVITTQTSDLEDFLFEGENGFFLNIDDEEDTKKKLKKVLTMSREQIAEMKDFCKQSKTFDYRNYIDDMEQFMIELKK